MSRRVTLKGAIIPIWEKFTADNITLAVGTSSETVADLQVAHDGNIYDLTEAAAAPGQDLILDFVDVPIFDYVRILAYYNGSASHFLTIQLFNWITSAWDTWDSMALNGSTHNRSFFVQEPTNYIGQGSDSGRVRARFLHPSMGIVTHHTFIDEISLFRFT